MFLLAPLPYPMDALTPFLSREQVEEHYARHQGGYVKKLNALAGQGKLEPGETLDDILAFRRPGDPVFDSGAQIWNHEFYWSGLLPSPPKGRRRGAGLGIPDEIAGLVRSFNKEAETAFGSCWLWLVVNGDSGEIEICKTRDADNPVRHGDRPILCLDLWEHAYYIDYRSDRAAYIRGFWPRVNWAVVRERIREARME